MGTFVTSNTPLPALKTNGPNNPPTGASSELDAVDINNLWSAAGDVRTHMQGNYYNILDSAYGAAVGAVDNSAAIQAAINAAQATTTGGVVFCPPGTFSYASTLVISGAKSVWLVGSGWGHNASGDGGSVLKYTGTGNAIEVGNTGADQTADVRLIGIRIQGQAGTGDGVKIMRTHNTLVEGCRVWGFGGNGINLVRAYASKIVRNYINNNTGSGIVANENNDFAIIRWNAILSNGAKGVWFTNGSSSGTRIVENDIEGNAVGIQVDAGSPSDQAETFTVGWNYLESQTGKNMSFGEDGSATRFVDNLMLVGNHMNLGVGGAGVNTVSLDRCRRPFILGNTFDVVNLLWTSNTTLVTLLGNYHNGSTFPTTNLRLSTSDDAITALGGALPRLQLQSNGWSVAHHLGMSYAGDTYEVGSNLLGSSSTQGNLDDTTQGGFFMRFAPASARLFFATAGANPRTLAAAAVWSSTDPLAVGYGATITIDSSTGSSFTIAPTDGVGFTLAAPTNGATGRRITVRIINTFGTLGAMSFGANVKASAWTQPANTFSRAIDLQYNGTNWVEVSRTTSDVPN